MLRVYPFRFRPLIMPTCSGMMGQYPFAAFVGKIIDYYGAWACSLISACLFSVGFGLFANEISKTPQDGITQPSISTFHNLVIFFFIGGLGTVFSYAHPLVHFACINAGMA